MTNKTRGLYYHFFLLIVISFSCKVWDSKLEQNNTYYIDPTIASNSFMDGSQKHPFRSWGDITQNKLWKPGGRYLQKCGTTFTGTLYFHGLVNGTSDKPVTMGAYGHGERPKVVGNGRYTLSLRDCSYWCIKDISFSGGSKRIILVAPENIDVHDIIITNCHIDGSSLMKKSGYHCVQILNVQGEDKLNQAYDIEISYNLIENGGEGNFNCDGLNLAVRSKVHVHHNIIQNNSGNGVDLAGGSGHIIEYNKLLNNGGTKAHSPHGFITNATIRHNLIYQEHASNFNAFGFSLQDSRNCKVYNNTVYLNNHGMGALILSANHTPVVFADNQMVNNIFIGARKGSASVRVLPMLVSEIDNNNNIFNNNIIGEALGGNYIIFHMGEKKENNIYINKENTSFWLNNHSQDILENPDAIDPDTGEAIFSETPQLLRKSTAKIKINGKEVDPGIIGVDKTELVKVVFKSKI